MTGAPGRLAVAAGGNSALDGGVETPLAGEVLSHHAYQGATNDCGPFCVAMVAGAVRDLSVDALLLAESLNRPARRWPVLRRVPGGATFPWGVVDALREYGISSRWFVRTRPEQLREMLARGHTPMVVLANLRERWGHWVVLLSWDPIRGWGVADPARMGGQRRYLDEEEFTRLWRESFRMVVDIDTAGAIVETST
jgi:hypothetical protein